MDVNARLTSQTTSNGVSERLFTLDDIPVVLWSPADATGSRPQPTDIEDAT